MAVLTLEKLVALGARALIVYGWCGSLNASLRIGDVLLPTWAVSDEGTSAHYPVEGRAESHGPSRTLLAEGLARQGLTVRSAARRQPSGKLTWQRSSSFRTNSGAPAGTPGSAPKISDKKAASFCIFWQSSLPGR